MNTVVSTARRSAWRALESRGRARTVGASRGSLPGPSPRQDFLLRRGNETFALRLLASELALSSDRLRLFPLRPLGRLLITAPPFHLAEDAFALHLLLQDPKRLVDVVVADENLQGMSLSQVVVTAADAARQEPRSCRRQETHVCDRTGRTHIPALLSGFGVGVRHARVQGQRGHSAGAASSKQARPGRVPHSVFEDTRRLPSTSRDNSQ